MKTIFETAGYQFVRVNEVHYEKFQELLFSSFGVIRTLDSIRNKFSTEQFGGKDIGVMGFDSFGDPVSYYGIYPSRLRIGERILVAAQSGDTMTHPMHRKRGLFNICANLTYEIAKSEGIELVFGFPNANSYPGFRDGLNWDFIDRMYDVVIPVRTIPLAAISKKSYLGLQLYGQYIKARLNVRLRTWKSEFDFPHPNSISCSVLKDMNYYYYKTAVDCTRIVVINDFELLIKVDGELIIGDVGYFKEDRFGEFVGVLKKLAFVLGCHKIRLSFSTTHWLFGYFVDSCWKPIVSLPIGYKSFNESLRITNASFVRSDYDTF